MPSLNAHLKGYMDHDAGGKKLERAFDQHQRGLQMASLYKSFQEHYRTKSVSSNAKATPNPSTAQLQSKSEPVREWTMSSEIPRLPTYSFL